MMQRTGPEIPASLTIKIDQKDGVWVVTCPELGLVDAHRERIEASYSRMGQMIAATLISDAEAMTGDEVGPG
jgi:predicted RNase H-like HicB family nuclease